MHITALCCCNRPSTDDEKSSQWNSTCSSALIVAIAIDDWRLKSSSGVWTHHSSEVNTLNTINATTQRRIVQTCKHYRPFIIVYKIDENNRIDNDHRNTNKKSTICMIMY
jgi:hypothetical protein